MENRRKITTVIFAILTIFIIGTIGYQSFLGVDWIDALYMTVITISTVGYKEVAEMTTEAKFFSIFIIFFGLGVWGYGLTSIISLFFEANIKNVWRKKRMEAKIHELMGHYIVCGAGEIGQIVIQQLLKNKVPFVVIEKEQAQVDKLMEEGILALQGDATHEDVLKTAGIKHARGFISSLAKDVDNVFAVLTARQMNEDLYIISKSIEKNSRIKLKKAGANNTISPNEIGGRRMAALLLRPSVISFLDVITHAGDVTLDLEEVAVCSNTQLVGKSLTEAKIPQKTGLIVLAIQKKGNKNIMFNPSSNEILEEGDKMIVLGTANQVELLKAIACNMEN